MIHRLRTHLTLLAWAGAALMSTAQAAGGAHEHGVVRLDVAVESGRITLQMHTPLDNLLGFERAPRTAAERQKVDLALVRLRAADSLFRFDAAAACRLSQVELTSAALKLGAMPAARAADAAHAELEARFEFACQDVAQTQFMDQQLFTAFGGIQRIEVQVVGAQQQLKHSLKRPATRIALVR